MMSLRHAALAIVLLSVGAWGVPTEALSVGAEAVEIVVTLVDPDIYLEQSKKVYFRTEKCVHK